MKIIEEYMDHDDPLESRMFYELMQAYRWADTALAGPTFEDVKTFIREHVLPREVSVNPQDPQR